MCPTVVQEVVYGRWRAPVRARVPAVTVLDGLADPALLDGLAGLAVLANAPAATAPITDRTSTAAMPSAITMRPRD
jgi:hypothetical protein